jgi:RNA polymerase sigma-70 factor (ECF subfamily)
MQTPNGNPEPERLIPLARSGSVEALGQLLDAYRNYLKLLAGLHIDRCLQGKVDPSDLVQETFLEAHRDFGQFRGVTEKELIGWLRQILVSNFANLVRHYRGTRRRDIRLERELALEMEHSFAVLDRGLFAREVSPSQQAARREQAVLLADALSRLPEDYRRAIILRHLEALSFAEVADRMGRSVDSVKKLWARALARLRDSLGTTE